MVSRKRTKNTGSSTSPASSAGSNKSRKQQLGGLEQSALEDFTLVDDSSFKLIPLNQIFLDPNNSRTRYLDIHNPTVNPFKEGDSRFQEYEEVIADILELAEHLKTEKIRQPISIYQTTYMRYNVSYGNRRYLALRIAFGPEHKTWCKVTDAKPDDLAISRFQENSSRKDLKGLPAIEEFSLAYDELTNLYPNQKFTDEFIAGKLGVSKSYAWSLRKVKENAIVMSFLEDGNTILNSQFKKVAKVSSRDELEAILDGSDKNLPLSEVSKPAKVVQKKAGRRFSSIALPKALKSDPQQFSKLVKGEFANAFDESDFESVDALVTKLKELFKDEKK